MVNMRVKLKQLISVTMAFSVAVCSAAAVSANAYVTNGGFEYLSFESGLSFSTPMYYINYGTESEREITNVESGEKITAVTDVINNSESSKKAAVVTAVYNSDGVMTGISCDVKDINPGSSEKYAYAVNVSDDNGTGGSIRSFVIDGFGSSMQYTESIGYPKNGLECSGWDMSDNASLTSAQKFSGQSSLRLKNISDGQSVRQKIVAEPDSAFKLNFYTKGCGGYNCNMLGDNGESLADSLTVDGCTDWENRSVLFKTKSDGTVNLAFSASSDGGESFIDSVSITDNMVSNSSFEAGASLWNINTMLGGIDQSEGFDDKHSLKIVSNTAATAASQSLELFPNSLYLVSFRTKGNAKLKTEVTTDSGKCIGGIAKSSESGDWVTNYAFLNSFDYSKITLNINTVESAGGVVYVDDVSIGKLVYPDIVRNGDFESDSLVDWLPEAINGVELRRLYDEEVVNTGHGAMMLTDKAVAHHAVRQFVTDSINNLGTGRYVLSGCMKYGDGATPVLRMIIDGANSPLAEKICEFDNGYSYFELQFDITSPVKDAIIRCYAANTMDDFWLDDIHIVKLP